MSDPAADALQDKRNRIDDMLYQKEHSHEGRLAKPTAQAPVLRQDTPGSHKAHYKAQQPKLNQEPPR